MRKNFIEPPPTGNILALGSSQAIQKNERKNVSKIKFQVQPCYLAVPMALQ